MTPLRFIIRLPFEINNKVIDPFFVTTKCSQPAQELTEKNTLLSYTLLIYNKLLGYKYIWFLGTTCFSPVVHKMFNHVREMEDTLLFTCIHHNQSLKNRM